MKKSLFFLLLSVFGFAQNITLKTTDSIRFRKQVEELAKATGKDYIFKEDTFDRQLGTYIEYHNPQDLNDRLIFFYFVFNDGENKELDNKGVKTWKLNNIKGKFLAIFPLWKKYEDSNANAEEVNKKGYILKGKNNAYTIKRISKENIWELSF